MRAFLLAALIAAGAISCTIEGPTRDKPAVATETKPAVASFVTETFETRPSTEPATTSASARYFDDTIALKLVADPEVRQGERLRGVDVVMTNEGKEPFTFFYSGNLLDFEVLDGAGDVIWKYLAVYLQPLGTFTLAPGESTAASELHWTSQGQWDLRESEGFPVEPGTYQVRGVLTFLLQDPAEDGSEQRLETPLHALTVHRASLPDYARVIELELIVPQEVRSGEPVTLDLRFTNFGQRPVVLWWSGHNQIPRFHHSDIVVVRGGAAVWRVVDANDVRGLGTVTLGPGESRSMSEIRFVTPGGGFKGSGEPWEWDQRADCGEHRFVPCELPVEPGIYTIRAVINVSPPETLDQVPPFTPERTALVTESHQLVITR